MPSKKEKPKQRLSHDERREAILDAAVPLFAEVGFHGTTTKRLAAHLGISEALLYQHFPSKEALYDEVQDCIFNRYPDLRAAFHALPPSAETLVFMIYLFANQVVNPPEGFDKNLIRVMLQSILGDGVFIRMHLEKKLKPVMHTGARCVAAARAAGDLVAEENDGTSDELRFWLAHQQVVMVMISRLPAEPLFNFPPDRAKLVDSIARQALRGIGLTAAAMTRCYRPEQLTDKLQQMMRAHTAT